MRKSRVLIFENEQVVLELLTDFLLMSEYEVLSFKEPVVCPAYGDEIARCVETYPCADIVVAEMHMPRMNGITLFKKQMERGCKIDNRNKALILGGHDPMDKETVEEMGVKCLAKPFPLAEMSQWLEECESRIDRSVKLAIKRRESRRSANISIRYSLNNDKQTYDGTIINISVCGLCVKTRDPLVKDHMMRIGTELPNFCDKASVRWVNELGNSSYMAGLMCC